MPEPRAAVALKKPAVSQEKRAVKILRGYDELEQRMTVVEAQDNDK